MKGPRHSSYPMSVDQREDLARQAQYGYSETDDLQVADARNYSFALATPTRPDWDRGI